MSTYISPVEKRWRSLALNAKLPLKMRMAALNNMRQATGAFLCKLIRHAEKTKDFRLVFHANEKLAGVRQQEFEKRLIARRSTPGKVFKTSLLD